jgi:RNA polymerase sigma factor (sigma-70 family)
VPPDVASLVSRASRGDSAACRALYDAHIDATFGACLAFARGDRDVAADLCQEAFVTAFSRLGDLRDPASFPGWLRTLARRTCLRWAGRRRTEAEAVERMGREPTAQSRFPEAALALVPEAIAACPDAGQRAAAALFYGDPPRSTTEISRELGISQTAVTTRLMRFRAWVRAHLLARLLDAMEEP